MHSNVQRPPSGLRRKMINARSMTLKMITKRNDEVQRSSLDSNRTDKLTTKSGMNTQPSNDGKPVHVQSSEQPFSFGSTPFMNLYVHQYPNASIHPSNSTHYQQNNNYSSALCRGSNTLAVPARFHARAGTALAEAAGVIAELEHCDGGEPVRGRNTQQRV